MTTSARSRAATSSESCSTAAGSAPWLFLMSDAPERWAQISTCSMAAARKVSDAQMTTFRPAWLSRCASLPMVVVFPTPLTPTMKTTRGWPSGGTVGAGLAEPGPAGTAGAAGGWVRISSRVPLIRPARVSKSCRASRETACRTRSRISSVVLTPMSAPMRMVSSCSSVEALNCFSPRTRFSMRPTSWSLVFLTACLSLLKKPVTMVSRPVQYSNISPW